MSQFDARQCCDDIALALAPVVDKYRHLMDQATLEQLGEDTITEYEALCRLIDPAIEAEFAAMKDTLRPTG